MQKVKKPAWGVQAVSSKEPTLEDKAKKYLRIGCTYFKIIDSPGIGRYLKRWNKSTIVQDHGRGVFYEVKKYDDESFLPDELKTLDVVK